MVPSYKIHSLVTSRLEKYRPQTEVWLMKNNIQYDNLIMLDLPSKKVRQETHAHVPHKAEYFKKNKDLSIFIESSKNQSIQIMQQTGKPVFCVDTNEMINPGWINQTIHNPQSRIANLRSIFAQLLPNFIKKLAKRFINKLKV